MIRFSVRRRPAGHVGEIMRRLLVLSLAVLALAGPSMAQQTPAPRGREDALAPVPVDVDIKPFLNDWRNSAPRTLYGGLVLRDIMSPLEDADPLRPARPGATMREITAISYATVEPGTPARGRVAAGARHTVYTTGGKGRITAGGKTFEISEGASFVLRSTYDFTLTADSGQPLSFYVRSDARVPDPSPNAPFGVENRFDGDRRLGIHWVHIQSGGAPGMIVITLPPNSMPHPHSHSNEEVWLMVKGQTVLSLGQHLVPMTPGQAIRIPPTGLTAHSSLNLSDEPVQMIVMIASGGASPLDYAQLDPAPIRPATDPDAGMFMGGWKQAATRIVHGNLYFRDMLTALDGADPLKPVRKGAVLANAQAVSYAQLEPGSTAHPIAGQLEGLHQTFVVHSGTGVITSGGRSVTLARDMAFTIPPGLDFRLTATGDRYMNFYVVTQKALASAAPPVLKVVDNRAAPAVTNSWASQERRLITDADGLAGYRFIAASQQAPDTMTRPYSVAAGGEEIWIATDGEVDLLLGKALIKLPAGTAFSVPPTGITPQAKLNVSGKPASFLYMAR
jgi:mannose-6-phosphate isomerase-like protein (cupin superfamily)